MNTPLYLSPAAKLIAAGFLGFLTGFIMMKSDLIWRKTVSGIFLLKDGRLLKTILLYFMLGTAGFFLLRRMNMVEVHTANGYFWASITGGIITGIGMVFCGFTPATAIAALSCGRLYVLWTLLGMLVSIPFVKYAGDFLSRTIYSWGDRMLTNEQPFYFLSASNPGLYITIIAVFLIFLVHFTVGDSD